eukprot:symbB.v1.2.018872.t1/scaffold1522.1/size113888/3
MAVPTGEIRLIKDLGARREFFFRCSQRFSQDFPSVCRSPPGKQLFLKPKTVWRTTEELSRCGAMAVAFRLRSRPGISDWSPEQVCDFLETLGLEASLRETFQREAIDGRVLCEMSDEDLSGPPFALSFGLRKALLKELAQQRKLESYRRPERSVERGPVLVKGNQLEGPDLSQDALERIRKWRLEVSTGRLVLREPPLTDDELDCWKYQAAWLVCPVTGKAWARSDVVSTMGVALYHAPRFCSEREKQRLFLEEEQARRYDAERKALMDHSGTSFERSYEVYPTVEPPPLANLPVTVADAGEPSAEQLQRLRAEVSGLKSRSAAVQRQMFEGLSQGGKLDFDDSQDVGKALEQLKVEPKNDVELAHKFSVYESYFSSVVDLRAELFSLWERGGPLLSPPDAQTMRGAINRVDSFDNLSIPERSFYPGGAWVHGGNSAFTAVGVGLAGSRHWFVYHMMSTASNNHRNLDSTEARDSGQERCRKSWKTWKNSSKQPKTVVMPEVRSWN